MVKFKNVTIKMKGGGTRKQRAKVLASGKLKFVKNLASKVRRKANPKSKRKTVRKMARRRRSRRRKSMTIPIAPILGLAAGALNEFVLGRALAGDFVGAGKAAVHRYIGIDGDGNFDAAMLAQGLGPLVLGLLIHKFVGGAPLHANRMLGQAGVPLIRI